MVRPLRFLARTLAWGERFTVASENLGTVNAFRILVRWRHSRDQHCIRARKFGSVVYFRGALDIGAMSLFFKPGYKIIPPERRALRIIDAGANIGAETLRFRYFHPDAQIISLEPSRENFRLLQLNCGEDSRIYLLNKGLWGDDGYLSVHAGAGKDGFYVSEVHDPKAGFDVEAISLPTLMQRYGWDTIDILKLDVEGAEKHIFETSDRHWINRTQVIIMECHDIYAPGAAQSIFSALHGLPFNLYTHGENLVFIRRDSGFRLTSDTYLERP